MMTDTSKGPHVMHGPDYLLSGGKDPVNLFQREHPLVDPVQVDHIRLLENRVIHNGESSVGY